MQSGKLITNDELRITWKRFASLQCYSEMCQNGLRNFTNSHTTVMRFKYEGVSKSPRTMLITRKSLVFHEFPVRVCCGGVL